MAPQERGIFMLCLFPFRLGTVEGVPTDVKMKRTRAVLNPMCMSKKSVPYFVRYSTPSETVGSVSGLMAYALILTIWQK